MNHLKEKAKRMEKDTNYVKKELVNFKTKPNVTEKKSGKYSKPTKCCRNKK